MHRTLQGQYPESLSQKQPRNNILKYILSLLYYNIHEREIHTVKIVFSYVKTGLEIFVSSIFNIPEC